MLSFANPIFLAGFIALGVPVFLHLMNRQIPQRVVFPSIRFLRRAQLPREGRRRLRDILLLSLRLLFLAAVVLAFARPIWTPPGKSGTEAAKTNRVTIVLLDTSASMSAMGVLDAAREQIRKQVAARIQGERFGLVLSSNGVDATVTPEDREDVLLRALNDVVVRPVAGDHTDALARAAELFPQGGTGRLVIVSDFQKGDWERRHPPALPPQVTVELLPVSAESLHNCGLVETSIVPLAEDTIRLVARIRNFSDIPQSRSLSLPTFPHIAPVTVEIPALSSRQAAFVIKQKTAAGLVLQSEADEYALDDTYHIWAGAMPPAQILAVTPVEQEPERAAEFFFLRKALDVPDETNPLRFSVESVEPEVFFALNLEQVSAIFLLGSGSYLREAGFEALHKFLDRGNTVIVTPGRSPAQEFHALRQYEFCNLRYIETAGENEKWGGSYGLGWVNPQSVLAGTFSNPETTDLFLFVIRKYIRLQPEDASTIVLKTIDGDPALLESPVGNGRLFVCALAFNPVWSDLPMTGSFLPLVRELLAPAIPPDHGLIRLDCGAPLPPVLDLLGQEARGKKTEEARIDTRSPGVAEIDGIPVEVNVSRRESLFDRVNLYDLKQTLSPTGTSVQPELPAGPELAQIPLWPAFARLAAGVLLAEMLLAGFLDRREMRGLGTPGQ